VTIWTVPARVVRVVDGDTLIMDLDLGWKIWRMGERCRLSGINAPELDVVEGGLARQFVEDVCLIAHAADEVTFVSRSLDKYGRPLGIVRLADGRILNDLILSAGHATSA
jgi:micrococcal nuclease